MFPFAHGWRPAQLLHPYDVLLPSRLDREQAMCARDRERAVADRESDSLGGASADITSRQHTGQRSLEGARVTIGPLPQARTDCIGAREQITVRIAANL